jgi:hypothetical protein
MADSAGISSYQHLWQISQVDFGRQESGTIHIPIIPKVSPATNGNPEEQHFQPMRNKEKEKNRF